MYLFIYGSFKYVSNSNYTALSFDHGDADNGNDSDYEKEIMMTVIMVIVKNMEILIKMAVIMIIGLMVHLVITVIAVL
jgi:hypothetical protein